MLWFPRLLQLLRTRELARFVFAPSMMTFVFCTRFVFVDSVVDRARPRVVCNENGKAEQSADETRCAGSISRQQRSVRTAELVMFVEIRRSSEYKATTLAGILWY